MRMRATARRALALGAALALGDAAPAAALDLVGRETAELAWAPARGEVSAYVVFVSRNGGPYRSEQYTQEPRASIAGRPGETLQVRVRAYGVAGEVTLSSATSEASEPIRFLPPGLRAEDSVPAAPAPPASPGASGPGVGSVRRIPGFQFAPPLRLEAHGDFDGDGDLDLVATLGSWRHPIALFLEQGTLEHAVVLPRLGDTTAALAADFDGDGKDELGLRGPAELSVVRVGRNGGLAPVRREPIPAGARLLAADLDGDGAASLVVYEPASGKLTERLGKENADFGSIRPLHALHAGDFDGNGRDDLWVQSQPGPVADLWLMNEAGSFAVVPVRLDRSVGAAAIADLNRDGRADLAGYDAGRQELRAFLLEGGRLIGERVLASGPLEAVARGDLDGDGGDDLLLRAPDGGASALVLSR